MSKERGNKAERGRVSVYKFPHLAPLLRFQWVQVEDDLSRGMNYAAAAVGLEATRG